GCAGATGGGGRGGAGSAGAAGGSGGTGGHGGIGGQAGAGAAGGAWYEDPSLWEAVPGSEFMGDRCRMSHAIPSRLGQKILEWEPCGPGCEKARLEGLGPVEDGGFLPELSTAEVGGVGMGFLRVSNGYSDESRSQEFDYVIR